MHIGFVTTEVALEQPPCRSPLSRFSKRTNMRQVVLVAPGIFAAREGKKPAAEAGCALVRICRVGVCGSDFHAFAGRHPIYTYPRIIGHELSGIVEYAPHNTRGIQEGDRCAIEPYLICGSCRACRAGRNNCCESIRLLGIHVDGGLQEFLSVPVDLLHKSEVLSLDQLALIETLGIGAHAVDRSALGSGEHALVVGAGPIGIAVAQFASERGAHVRIVEKTEFRRNFVAGMGYVSSATIEGEQADVVFDATGNAFAMGKSLEAVATGGRLVFVGLTRDPVSIDDALFHRKEITILSSRNSFGLFPRIIKLIENGRIDTSHWITDRLSLEDIVSRFASLPSRGTLIKAVVDMNGTR
jgi:2-desacetyl-2-hydroxyethyl bacteriochlorophyllide A dehydrogenase